MDPPLLACSGCIFQTWQLLFPPTAAWSLIGPSWFVGLSLYARRAELPLPLVPGVFRSVLYVFAGFLLGAAIFGPFTLVPFVPACVPACVRLLRAKGGPAGGRVVALVGLLALAVSGAWAYVAASGPPTAKLIFDRRTYGLSVDSEMARLREGGAASLPVWRTIAGRSSDTALFEEAIARIREFGRTEEEVPLLIEALVSCRASRRRLHADNLDGALRRITGLDPPAEPPGEESEDGGWRAAWKGRRTGK